MDNQFWTIERKPDESQRDFIFRTWREANPYLPEDIAANPYKLRGRRHGHGEIVPQGYGSPYRFGRILRDMVQSSQESLGAVPIFKFTETDAKGFELHVTYFAWNGPETDKFESGPHIAAFYNPANGPTFGNPNWKGQD
jgi:hypothetical protein